MAMAIAMPAAKAGSGLGAVADLPEDWPDRSARARSMIIGARSGSTCSASSGDGAARRRTPVDGSGGGASAAGARRGSDGIIGGVGAN